MRICVTKKDIAMARLAICGGPRATCCPIAQSLKRRGFKDCMVGTDCMWTVMHKSDKLPLPAIAQQFISNFDNRRAVRPITFTIEKA